MTKDEIIESLSNSDSFDKTHSIIEAIKDEIVWTDEEVEKLCDLAIKNKQIFGTLSYKWKSAVRDFYVGMLSSYNGMGTEETNKVENSIIVFDKQELYNFYEAEKEKINTIKWVDSEKREFSSCDGLYHANSVSTFISFIREGKLCSRLYGEENFPNTQTLQKSDDKDKKLGIWNDIFFDNCDIRLFTGNHSSYGPITAVFDDKLLLLETINVKIWRYNPFNINPNTRKRVFERYFISIDELKKETERLESEKKSFRREFGFHTILENCPCFFETFDFLKYIIVEKNEDLRKSIIVKELIQDELKKINHGDIPVVIRADVGKINPTQLANNIDELWKIPD